MRCVLFFSALLSGFAVHAGELKLELEGKGMAGNQIRVAVYSANAPEQFPSDDKFIGASYTRNERPLDRAYSQSA